MVNKGKKMERATMSQGEAEVANQQVGCEDCKLAIVNELN